MQLIITYIIIYILKHNNLTNKGSFMSLFYNMTAATYNCLATAAGVVRDSVAASANFVQNHKVKTAAAAAVAGAVIAHSMNPDLFSLYTLDETIEVIPGIFSDEITRTTTPIPTTLGRAVNCIYNTLPEETRTMYSTGLGNLGNILGTYTAGLAVLGFTRGAVVGWNELQHQLATAADVAKVAAYGLAGAGVATFVGHAPSIGAGMMFLGGMATDAPGSENGLAGIISLLMVSSGIALVLLPIAVIAGEGITGIERLLPQAQENDRVEPQHH